MKRVWLLGRLSVLLLLVVLVSQSIAQTLTSDAPPEQKLWEILLKALFPPIWTALSPLLTGLISTGMTRLGGSLSPTLRYVTSTVIGTVTGALAGTVDAFPLTSESAANMGGTAGLTGQWLAERNPTLFGGASTLPATTGAKTVPVILLAFLMTGCISLSAKVCTPESVTAMMPDSWPSSLKKACPVDFNYSNMTPETQKATLLLVPNQTETSEVKPINRLTPMTVYPESNWLVAPYNENQSITLENRAIVTTPNHAVLVPGSPTDDGR